MEMGLVLEPRAELRLWMCPGRSSLGERRQQRLEINLGSKQDPNDSIKEN